MVLDFSEADRRARGNCAAELTELKSFSFEPAACAGRTDSSDATLSFRVFNPDHFPIQGMPVPDGGPQYALEYETADKHLTPGQVADRLRSGLGRHFRKDLPDREEVIEEQVTKHLEAHPDGDTAPVSTFHRWLGKAEFNKLAAEALSQSEQGSQVSIRTKWESLSTEDRNLRCGNCPLSTSDDPRSNPYVEKLDALMKSSGHAAREQLLRERLSWLLADEDGLHPQNEYQQIFETDSKYLPDLVYALLKQAKQHPQLEELAGQLTNRYVPVFGMSDYSCSQATNLREFGGYMYFISGFLAPEVLSHEFLEEHRGVPVESLSTFEAELRAARAVLEAESIPAVSTFNRNGQIIGISAEPNWDTIGSDYHAYGFELDFQRAGIMLRFQESWLRSMPHEALFRFLSTRDETEAALWDKSRPTFYFQEIYREGSTCFGKTARGTLIELPPVEFAEEELTPFSGFHNGDRISRMVCTTIPAIECYGGVQKWLENYLDVAKANQMAIIASG